MRLNIFGGPSATVSVVDAVNPPTPVISNAPAPLDYFKELQDFLVGTSGTNTSFLDRMKTLDIFNLSAAEKRSVLTMSSNQYIQANREMFDTNSGSVFTLPQKLNFENSFKNVKSQTRASYI